MVHLRSVPNAFHAHVIAARLGADGIITQLRGGVDGIYPVGEVAIFVPEEEFESAQELLLADEVESAFEAPAATGSWRHGRVVVAVALGLLFLLFVLQMVHG